MTSTSRRRAWSAAVAILGSVGVAFAQPAAPRDGREIYQAGCSACHGTDGTGAPRSSVGFDTRLPDFTKCSFTTSEPDADWLATIQLGGPARGLDPNMPAFGGSLSDAEIASVVRYLRGFCSSRAWPSGNLNLPRPLVTAKAFPENEAVLTTAVPTHETDRVDTQVEIERRLGARGQYELVVPFNVVKWPGGWNRGLGDISVGFKYAAFHSAAHGSMLSGSLETTFPTGKETEGLGNRLLVFEPSAIVSQALPLNGFVHGQIGMAFPANNDAALNEVFWRAAAGATFAQGRWGRIWSPMVELLGSRELEFGEPTHVDVAPELVVTLNRRQHVMASGGVRIPITVRSRGPTVMASLVWEWSQGSLLSGW
jgi:mono/diheme cytochrome c family protein